MLFFGENEYILKKGKSIRNKFGLARRILSTRAGHRTSWQEMFFQVFQNDSHSIWEIFNASFSDYNQLNLVKKENPWRFGSNSHCVKSIPIWTRNNSVFGHFSRSVYVTWLRATFTFHFHIMFEFSNYYQPHN